MDDPVIELDDLMDRVRAASDIAVVLSPSAGRLAEEIVRAAHPIRGLTVGAAVTLGRYHWLRYCALPPGEDVPDLLAAMRICEPVARIDPQLVPPIVHMLLPLQDAPKPEDPDLLADPAIAMLQHAEGLDAPRVVDHAIQLLRRAVVIDGGAAARPRLIGNLSTALYERVTRGLGDTDRDLDEAIALARGASSAIPPDHPDQLGLAATLSNQLWTRFEQRSDVADLTEAVALGERALDTAGPDPEIRAGLLNNQAIRFRTRYTFTSDLNDLDWAVELGRDAVACLPDGSRDWATYLNNLSVSLNERFKHHGELQDTHEAVASARQSLTSLPDDDLRAPFFLTNAGCILHDRFRARRDDGRLSDLDAAVAMHRSAVERTGDDNLRLAFRLSNVANSLTERFELCGDGADISEAITAGNRALGLLSGGTHQLYPLVVSNLGYAYRCRYQAEGRAKDAAEAILCAQRVLDSCPVDHPERAKYYHNLGICHWLRFESEHRTADAEKALECFRTGAHSATAPTSERLSAAEAWGTLAALIDDWNTGAEAYRLAVELLPRVAWRGVSRTSREVHLTSRSGVATDAAALSLHSGGDDVIVLLEHGRAVLWGQQLDARADLRTLAAQNEHLATRLDHIRGELT